MSFDLPIDTVPGGPTHQRLSLPYFSHACGLLLEPPDLTPSWPGLAAGQAPPSTAPSGPSTPSPPRVSIKPGPYPHYSFALVQNAAERPPSPLRTSSAPSSCARRLPHPPLAPTSRREPCHRRRPGRGDRPGARPCASSRLGRPGRHRGPHTPRRCSFGPTRSSTVFFLISLFPLNYKNLYKFLKFIENLIKLRKIQNKFPYNPLEKI
jgi:hypothetical protein